MSPLSHAFALNNMGVEMMTRGQIQHAAVTLIDSLAIMKLIMGNRKEPDNATKEQMLVRFAQEKLQLAHSRFSDQATMEESCKFRSAAHRFKAIESNDFSSLQVEAYKTSSTPARAYSEHCHTFILIRDTFDHEFESSEISAQIGIILYNHALACFVLSNMFQCPTTSQVTKETKTCEKTRNVYRSMAYKSLIRAGKTFSRRLEMEEQSSLEQLETCFLYSLVLKYTRNVLWSRQDCARAQQIDQYIEFLLTTNSDQATCLVMNNSNAACAA